MFFDNAFGLIRILVVGSLAYLWLIAVLRLTGKRTLAQLNAYDFIVTVALGSTLATVLLSDSVALAEGMLGLALLAGLQFVAAYLSSRSDKVRRGITAGPSLLFRDGKPIPEALNSARMTEESLKQAVRSSGIGGMELVAWIVLETNGKISVVSSSQAGSGSALPNVPR